MSFNKEIADALKEGTYEVYQELFSTCSYFPLDRGTKVSIYKESKEKLYLTPIPLISQVKVLTQEEKIENKVTYGVRIKVPVKSFTLNNFTLDPENDYSYLKSGLFLHGGVYYRIVKMTIGNIIQDEVMSYTFICERTKANGI